jgi:hypothetical protein
MDEATLKRLEDHEREWVETKLALGSVDLQDLKIAGFGSKIISQLLKSNTHCSELHKAVRTNEWANAFAKHFLEVLWICAARRQTFA